MKHLIAILLFLNFSGAAVANDDHVGTICRKVGKVYVLADPSKSVQGPPPHAKFEGLFYTEKLASEGTKIKLGEVIRTSKVGRAKIVYPNGDHFTIGPSSSFKLELNSENQIKTPTVEVYNGRFRALIESGGPKSGTVVRTRSIVMGVRGTDFFVDAYNKNGKSEVTVIRGKVEVAPLTTDKTKPIPVEVPAGFSLAVAKPTKATTVNPVEMKVVRSKPANLVSIAKLSKMPDKDPSDEGEEPINPNVQKEIEKLERQAAVNTMQDIKRHDPKLYRAIKRSKKDIESNFEMLDTIVNSQIEEAAKTEMNQKKTPKPDLDGGDEDIYDKYYKN